MLRVLARDVLVGQDHVVALGASEADESADDSKTLPATARG